MEVGSYLVRYDFDYLPNWMKGVRATRNQCWGVVLLVSVGWLFVWEDDKCVKRKWEEFEDVPPWPTQTLDKAFLYIELLRIHSKAEEDCWLFSLQQTHTNAPTLFFFWLTHEQTFTLISEQSCRYVHCSQYSQIQAGIFHLVHNLNIFFW